MDKMKCETESGVERNVDKIAAMFPQVVTEVKGEDGKIRRAVKWDVLKELLSGEYVEGGECYDFTWPGKRAAIAEAAKSIRKTLRPCKAESKDWDTTENLYIEGDNLEVLKLLQESYLGKIKMIYIDPPYNTGNDFVYRDDFKVGSGQWAVDSGELFEDEETGETNRMFRNTGANGRFHSDWCSMIYSRLALSRDLLSDDGVIFISIDDNEVENLRKICDEIFGEGNYINHFAWVVNITGRQISGSGAAKTWESVLLYAKDINNVGLMPIDINFAKEKMPDAYKGFDKDIRSDERGKFAIGDTLYNHNRKFNEETRRNLVFSIFYNQTTGEITTGNIGEKKDGYIEIPPHKNGDGVHKYHAWRWSRQKIESESYDLIVLTTPSGKLEIYTKIRNFAITTLKDLITNISNGDAELQKLFDGKKYFDYPKSVDLLITLLNGMNDNAGVVLDFFSGSATTAHAIMQLNAEDGGKRKFIMVQLPEECPPDSEAAKAGYANICEIGKERIRRAGAKIKEEAGLAAANLDIGFRVFKVADSNMKDVYYSADDYKQKTLDELISNIKEDRTDLDLLYGCLLEWGVELSLPHASETIDGVTVHTVNNGDLIACFDPNIPESAIRAIAKRQPLRAVFRDSSFASAPQKINVEEIFKLLSPATTVKVI